MKKNTILRNAQIVGHNSKSYNDKHPENPVSLRPIHNAIKKLPPIIGAKGIPHFDSKRASKMRWYGSFLAKPYIPGMLAAVSPR